MVTRRGGDVVLSSRRVWGVGSDGKLVCVCVGGACEWSVVCKGLELDEKRQV